MTKQPGYVQLPVREVSRKIADQKGASGSPAFFSYDLILIVLLCLLAFVYLIFFVQRCYCNGVYLKGKSCGIVGRQFWIIASFIVVVYKLSTNDVSRWYWRMWVVESKQKYVCTRNKLLMLHWLAVV